MAKKEMIKKETEEELVPVYEFHFNTMEKKVDVRTVMCREKLYSYHTVNGDKFFTYKELITKEQMDQILRPYASVYMCSVTNDPQAFLTKYIEFLEQEKTELEKKFRKEEGRINQDIEKLKAALENE